jgi:hypothetical protein
MKIHLQTIINVCLAVSVTFLIYQNNQLKDELRVENMYEGIALNDLQAKVEKTEVLLNSTIEVLEEWSTVIDNSLVDIEYNTKNIEILESNSDILFRDRDKLIESANLQKDYINDINKRFSALVDTLSEMYK